MDRRAFLTGTGAMLLAAPLAAEAQPARKVHMSEYSKPVPRLSRSLRPFGRDCEISDTSRDETSFLNIDGRKESSTDFLSWQRNWLA